MHNFRATSLSALRRARRPALVGGFTLIELIVVMVVIMILAGTAIPAIMSIGESRAAAAARQLLTDMTLARQRAVSTGTVCWVVLGDDESWTVLIEDTDQPGRANATALIDAATGRPHRVEFATEYPTIELTEVDLDGGQEVGFDWLGRPIVDDDQPLDQQGSVTLSGDHRVMIEPGTGYASYVGP